MKLRSKIARVAIAGAVVLGGLGVSALGAAPASAGPFPTVEILKPHWKLSFCERYPEICDPPVIIEEEWPPPPDCWVCDVDFDLDDVITQPVLDRQFQLRQVQAFRG